MPRPKEGYKCKDGASVPGVTTILSQNLGWNKGAMMGWAWKQGKAGKNLRDTQDEAMAIGTIAHQMIEAELQGCAPDQVLVTVTPEQRDKLDNCMLAFYEWRDAFKPVIIKSEFPLVSETWRFGCTPDHLATINRYSLLEVKTGTGDSAYPDWWMQLAAQGKAVLDNEMGHIEGYHILKVGKEDAGFAHFYKPDLSAHWEAFKLLLGLEKLRREIGK